MTQPCTPRPSAKVTWVVRSRRLWALVSTRLVATTTPVPRPWRPMATVAGAAAAVTALAAALRSARGFDVVIAGSEQVTCELQVTISGGRRFATGQTRIRAPPTDHPPSGPIHP